MGNKPIHWHILGAGSIGLLFAHCLSKQQQVTLITQRHKVSSHPQFLGFIVEENSLRTQCKLPIELPLCNSPIENLLICVKSHQTQEALTSISHRITPKTSMVLLQNGLGNESFLLNGFPENHIYKAITTEAAKRDGDNHIYHTGQGITQIAPLSNSAQISDISNKLNCELSIEYHDDMDSIIWHKLIVNCVINPLTVIHDCLNGELLHVENIHHQITSITTECVEVAKRHGIALNIQECLATVLGVIRSTAKNSSSMREDFRLNRATEIDFINGFIVGEALKYGINVPSNEKLVTTIKKLDQNS